MNERLAIVLPDDVSEAQQDELIASLQQIDEVEEDRKSTRLNSSH